ncbi:MAG: sulfatase [Planctomycetia bacterium]|nr:sulfatase [Planctomycetia bacterium]
MPKIMLILAATLAMAANISAADRPNVVLILADDLGWADLGCYGNKFNETPRIDGLAKQGMRFAQFYAAAAVCSPTRAAILSGQHPARLGLTAHIPGHWRPFEQLVEPPNAVRLPLEVVTLAERLREAGYATAQFGKWHLGGAGFGPKEQGFGVAQELGGHVVPGPRQVPPAAEPKRTADYLADRTIDFIEHNRANSFFVYVCHTAVHIPLDTTPELQRKYESKPRVEGYSCHPLYASLLEEMDASTGRILDVLDRLGLADDTIVIFTSDNGGLEREMGGWPGTLNRPLRSEKGTLYEGGLRVPLIVRWPGKTPEASRCDRTGISADLYPTILSAVGTSPPDQPADGLSLLPLLRDPAARLDREALFWHYPHYHHSRPSGAIRLGDFKAIEYFDTGEIELYNLKDDLSESKNLATAMPEQTAKLRDKLAEWRSNVNAQMPQPNPAFNAARRNEWWSRATIAPTSAPGTYRPGGN